MPELNIYHQSPKSVQKSPQKPICMAIITTVFAFFWERMNLLISRMRPISQTSQKMTTSYLRQSSSVISVLSLSTYTLLLSLWQIYIKWSALVFLPMFYLQKSVCACAYGRCCSSLRTLSAKGRAGLLVVEKESPDWLSGRLLSFLIKVYS